jgi:hypothetical protein
MIGRALSLIFCVSCFSQAQSLEQILGRVGNGVGKFGSDFAVVKCTEKVAQTKLNDKGKPVQRSTASFDYVASINNDRGGPRLEESRLRQSNSEKNSTGGLSTDGFAGLILIFHPQIQRNYDFFDDGLDSINAQEVRRIRFQHRPASPSTAAFRDRDRLFPIEWAGEAWVDPVTGLLLRIHASSMNPIAELGIRSLDATVEYSAISFAEANVPYWLPVIATVDLRTQRQHWRNTHTFQDYRRFSTTVRTLTP